MTVFLSDYICHLADFFVPRSSRLPTHARVLYSYYFWFSTFVSDGPARQAARSYGRMMDTAICTPCTRAGESPQNSLARASTSIKNFIALSFAYYCVIKKILLITEVYNNDGWINKLHILLVIKLMVLKDRCSPIAAWSASSELIQHFIKGGNIWSSRLLDSPRLSRFFQKLHTFIAKLTFLSKWMLTLLVFYTLFVEHFDDF